MQVPPIALVLLGDLGQAAGPLWAWPCFLMDILQDVGRPQNSFENISWQQSLVLLSLSHCPLFPTPTLGEEEGPAESMGRKVGIWRLPEGPAPSITGLGEGPALLGQSPLCGHL